MPAQDITSSEKGKKNSLLAYWSPTLVLTTFLVWFGSAIPTGYNLGVINTPSQILKEFINDTAYRRSDTPMSTDELDMMWSFVVSSFLFGGCIGSLSAGWLSSTLGRKPTIYIDAGLQIVGAVMFAVCKTLASYELLILGRFFAGISAGLSFAVVSMYLTEIGPVQLRGSLGVVQLTGLTLGIIIAQVFGLDFIMGTEVAWPALLSVQGAMASVTFLSFWLCPESPKFLYVVKRNDKAAETAIKRFRNTEEEAQFELSEMKKEASLSVERKYTLGMILKHKGLRKMLFLVCAIQMSQQLSGINVVFFYSNIMFKDVGFTQKETQVINIGAGVCNFVMALVTLPVCQRFGRRRLLMTSYSLTALCLIGITIVSSLTHLGEPLKYISVAMVMLFIACFNIGIGPIPFFIGSELFSPGPRALAMSLGAACNWCGNIIVGITFPIMMKAMATFSFLTFACVLLIMLIIVYFCLPETKGRDPSDIVEENLAGFPPSETKQLK